MRGSKILLSLVGIAIAALAFGSLASAQTASRSNPLLIPCDQTITDGDNVTIDPNNECTIQKFFQQFILLSQWGLTLVVFLAVLMMIYGGFSWVTAGGRSSKIEEGKRVVLGTIVGVVISFTAYITVNFAVAAITGTTTQLNPFSGPIATIFGGTDLEQPFSGDQSSNPGTAQGCRETWDNNCSNQIYCADPGSKPGGVWDIQEQLNVKGCTVTTDGCFGVDTARAVRKFQIANEILPTGVVDDKTRTALFGVGPGLGRSCDDPLVSTEAAQIESSLSVPSLSQAKGESATTRGCCVFLRTNDVDSEATFCADQTTKRGCLAAGANNIFVENKSCYLNEVTNDLCGFCHNFEGRCYGGTTEYWCEEKIQPATTFVRGIGNGLALCRDGAGTSQYIEALHLTKP